MHGRLGSDRTGRGFAWLYEYDAGSLDVLEQATPDAADIPATTA